MNSSLKLYIFEGIDNIGKTTLIENFSKSFQRPLIVKFSSPPRDVPEEKRNEYQFNYFNEQFQRFNLLRSSDEHDAVIWDRSHLGENVYGLMFRGYNPKNELFRLEMSHSVDYHDTGNSFQKDSFLFLLKSTPAFSLNNEDGETMFLTLAQLKEWNSKWRNYFSFHDVEELEFTMNDIKNNMEFDPKIASKLLENALFDWTFDNSIITNKTKIWVHDKRLEFFPKEDLVRKITNFVNAKNQSCD